MTAAAEHVRARTLKSLADAAMTRAEALGRELEKGASRQGARTDLFDNIQEVSAPTGTSQAAALRRLRTPEPT